MTGCQKSGETPPERPTCANGFRNQCVDEAAIGSQFGCALLGDRTVWCWGRNDQGQVGYNTTDLCPEDIGGGKTRSVACHTFPFQVNDLDDVRAIASGDAFSCAIVGDAGAVRCWGGNAHGELGNGKTITSQTPVAVSLIANATQVVLGRNHACALSGGAVWCWGANDRGQLGSGTTTTCKLDNGSEVPCATTPVAVSFVHDVSALTAGAEHTCALLKDRTVTCWGDNRWGQLGVGTTAQSVKQPVDDAGVDSSADAGGDAGAPRGGSVLVALGEPLTYISSISAGAFHTCALREGGDVYCWGRDDHQELGGPAPPSGAVKCDGPCAALAVMVPNLPPTIEVAADAGSETADDAPRGDADATIEDTSVADAAIDATAPSGGIFGRVLSSGDAFSCLRVADGTVRCWGIDSVGQLGDGRTASDPRGPTLVIASPGAAKNNPLQGAAKVRVGASSACAIMSDRSLRCWGSNQNGALGVGHFMPQQGPVPVSW